MGCLLGEKIRGTSEENEIVEDKPIKSQEKKAIHEQESVELALN